MDLQRVEKMPLSCIALPPDSKGFYNAFFTDIIRRHSLGGDLHAMMMEAYVLGFHHSQTAGGATP